MVFSGSMFDILVCCMYFAVLAISGRVTKFCNEEERKNNS